MEPFNIKLTRSNHTVTLTILPTEQGIYKVVYYGGILAGLRVAEHTKEWILVPQEELEAGDLPFFVDAPDSDRVQISLDKSTIKQMGVEIEQTMEQT